MNNEKENPSIEISVSFGFVERFFIFLSRVWWVVLLFIAVFLAAVFFYQRSMPDRYQAVGTIEIGLNGTEAIETQDKLIGYLGEPTSFPPSVQTSCLMAGDPAASASGAAPNFTPSKADARAVQVAAIMATPDAAKQCVADLVTMIQDRHKRMQDRWEASEKADLAKRLEYVKTLRAQLEKRDQASPAASGVEVVLPFDTTLVGKIEPTTLSYPIQVKLIEKMNIKRILVLGVLLTLLLAISVVVGRNFAALRREAGK